MYSYSKIVFGLKHHQRLYECRTLIKYINSLCIMISEHDAVTDDCERPGLHYHGIIEHGKGTVVDHNNAVDLLRKNCTYFKEETCDDPEQFVVELARPPKKMMVIEIAKSFNLKTYYSKISVADIRFEVGDYEREVSKMNEMKFIISGMLARKILNPEKISSGINNSYYSTPDKDKSFIKHSIDLVHQKILDQSILLLCGAFVEVPDNYYTIRESVGLVGEWCQYQNIDVEEFTMNWVRCLDREISYRNSLFFQGPSESGIFCIISSILDACAFIGEVESENTGYTYVWEKCVDKRCIIMRDPIFDERMFEELENILRGIGTFVPHRQCSLKYIRPTPVVICNQNDKENQSYLQRIQNNFIKSYVNLKPFLKLNNDRRLHPDWLNALFMCFTRNKIDYPTSSCDVLMKSSMEVDSSCRFTEEAVSSVTTAAGCISSPFCGQDS